MVYRILVLAFVLMSCQKQPKDVEKIRLLPSIIPDYKDVVIPKNIAPLNFYLSDYCNQVCADFIIGDSLFLRINEKKTIAVDPSKWKVMLAYAYATKLPVNVVLTKKLDGKWLEYEPFSFFVKEDIDSYISYRLIPPGYENWDKMNIYQRDLTSFDVKTILSNQQTNNGCINCHTSSANHESKYIVHARGKTSGTLLVDGDKKMMLNGQIKNLPNGLTYPSWHPSGNYIAFSSNKTAQFFHSSILKQIEVYDSESDIVLFDIDRKCIMQVPQLCSKSYNDTYPQWDNNGETLYFCRTDTIQSIEQYKRIKYTLCSIAFNAADRTFANKIDTVLCLPSSIVFPQISPCSGYISFTTLDYGCFPIWHKESDIHIMDINTKSILPSEHNSNFSDSYHKWSSNGKWLMFTSRRDDDWHSRLYFTYINEDGQSSKPFILPQNEFEVDYPQLFSYNVPQFLKNPIKEQPSTLARVMKGYKQTIEMSEH
ncbi:MAG: TolB family protein [Marinifilaceae bacterium]